MKSMKYYYSYLVHYKASISEAFGKLYIWQARVKTELVKDKLTM